MKATLLLLPFLMYSCSAEEREYDKQFWKSETIRLKMRDYRDVMRTKTSAELRLTIIELDSLMEVSKTIK